MTVTPTTDKDKDKDNNDNGPILLEGKAYKTFMNAFKSPATRTSYIFVLKKFMKFHNYKTLDELLAIAKKETNDKSTTYYEDKIIEWIIALRDDPKYQIVFGTLQTYVFSLFSFFEVFDIFLRKKKIIRFLGEQKTKTHKDRAYTVDEIRKILEYTDLRSRVIVLLMASTGMRIGAIPDLKLKHLKKVKDYNINLYEITVYENTKDEYTVFCTPECAASIDEYLSYRQQFGEVLTDDSPFIRDKFNNKAQAATTEKVKPMALRGIGEIVYILLLKSKLNTTTSIKEHHDKDGMRYGTHRKIIKRSHGFRKFVNTQMVEAQLDLVTRQMLLGHNIGLDRSYYKPTKKKMLEEYLKAVDLLTINEENRLKKKVAILEKKQDDIDLMKAEQRRKDLKLREQMKQQQQQYQRMIEEFQDRDRKEKEELRREITGTLEAVRALVTDGNDDSIAKNKAYHLQPEDTETKETLKKAQTRAAEQLRKDTLAEYSRRRRLRSSNSINNRIQQQSQHHE